MTYCCLKIFTARTISLYWPFLNLRRGILLLDINVVRLTLQTFYVFSQLPSLDLHHVNDCGPCQYRRCDYGSRQILTALNLTTVHPGMQSLDLASLRPGGATWLLQVTEQSELVRRRGRWVTAKVMEVYLQEMSAARYLNCLDDGQKAKLFGMAYGFQSILRQAESFVEAMIPVTIWFKVFCWT